MDRKWIPLACLGGSAAACVAITIANPSDSGVPLCPTKAVLGFDCPFCGGLRAVASLGRGRVLEALDHNVLLVALVPVVAVWWVLWARSYWLDRPPPRLVVPNWAWNVGATALLGYTVFRNLKGNAVSRYLYSDLRA